jgi:preprotein translocase subunit SecY
MALGVGFGMMLLILPGIILYLMWVVATPVMMAEDRGIIDSLKRSAELTSGSKRMIFVLLLIFFVLTIVFGLFVAMVGSISAIFLAIITLVSNTITGALQGAGVASIYVDLRTAKEGTDTSALAEIFA